MFFEVHTPLSSPLVRWFKCFPNKEVLSWATRTPHIPSNARLLASPLYLGDRIASDFFVVVFQKDPPYGPISLDFRIFREIPTHSLPPSFV